MAPRRKQPRGDIAALQARVELVRAIFAAVRDHNATQEVHHGQAADAR